MTGKISGFLTTRRFENGSTGIVLLLVLSLCFKLWVLLRVQVINPDAVQYLQAAQDWLSGDFQGALEHYRMPFYPMLIAAVRLFLVPDLVWAGRLLSVFFLTGLMVPFCFLVKEAWGNKAAFLAGALLASSPYFNRHAADVVRDPAFLFFLAWGTWATWRLMKSGRFLWAFLAGLMAALATLCRIEGALLLVAFPAACLTGGHGLSIRRRLGLALVLIVAAPVCVSPVAGWMALRMGDLPASRLPELLQVEKKVILLFEKYHLYYDILGHVEKNLPGGPTPHNFFEIARHYIALIYLAGLTESFVRVVSPAIGFVSALGLKTWKTLTAQIRWTLGWVFLGYLALALLVRFQDAWHSDRFILVPAMVWSLGAGQGVIHLWKWRRQRWTAAWQRGAATFIMIALLLSPAFKTLTYEAGREQNIREAGHWIARHGRIGTTVFTNDDRIAFYADLPAVRLDPGQQEADQLIADNPDILIALRGSKTDLSRFLAFSKVKPIQEFPGKRKTVWIIGTRVPPPPGEK